MNADRSSPSGQVPLPGSDRRGPADAAVQSRNDGLRRVRRMSNWTVAALIVGTGAATVALAHNAATPASTPWATTTTSATGTGATGAANAAGGPHVAHTVATTSASGVTTTTTTKVVNGKTVVTHVKHVPAHHDN